MLARPLTDHCQSDIFDALLGREVWMQFDRLRRREFITLARQCGGLAAGSARATKGADDRVPGTGLSVGHERVDSRVCAAAARARSCRGAYHRDRISLGDGRSDRLAEFAAEFVRLKVDVIVTTGTGIPPLKQATSVIPIVFTIANDPIGGGS